MKNLDMMENKLRENITKLLVPLQTERRVDDAAFAAVDKAANALAAALRGNVTLPRNLLNEMYVTFTILRREAAHLPRKASAVEDMANRLEMTFALILKGESHQERVPGVPRVI